MGQVQNMQTLFERLGDLKSFFVYGQKLIPTLQKIVDFMQATIPLLETVNQSIQESTNKLPKAAVQIDSVTNATEVAVTEILDVVDEATSDCVTIISKLESLRTRLDYQKKSIQRLTEKYPDDPDVKELVANGLNPEVILEDYTSVTALAGKIQAGLMNITISLQVQDITSQQLASANHMMNSIQQKLSSLLYDIDVKDLKETADDAKISVSSDLAFNPEARYDKNHETQAFADLLVAENKTQTSQKEIDELFLKK
ncbi:MAG: Cemotaxis phosphatase CheZ [Ignavibacteria bacterium]|nr:MAG: Cemotaxis phosphatase CheZ [Ignavibacteria bacterium]KAF0160748.1 MAG: Cemotaxis phosphatase CheZ [Ignavibacteria bacterium]